MESLINCRNSSLCWNLLPVAVLELVLRPIYLILMKDNEKIQLMCVKFQFYLNFFYIEVIFEQLAAVRGQKSQNYYIYTYH